MASSIRYTSHRETVLITGTSDNSELINSLAVMGGVSEEFFSAHLIAVLSLPQI